MNLPRRIMIVEDEVITQHFLKNILKEYDHNIDIIDCFDNADSVLKAIKKTYYEMILMDINIKGSVDGIQLSKNILKKYITPIIFISAYNDDETLEEVLELSPYGFITKPFSSSEVIASLKVAYKRFLTGQQKDLEQKSKESIYINKIYCYDLENSILYYCGTKVLLNVKQNILIRTLVKSLNQSVSFEALIVQIWGAENITDTSLRTLVYNIRKRLPDLPLYTHSKYGYYLQKD